MACSHDDDRNHIVLFQGDSITDAFRDRDNPDSMGRGYPLLVSAWFGALVPGEPGPVY